MLPPLLLKLLLALAAFFIGELIAWISFAMVRRLYAPQLEGVEKSRHAAMLKGVLERLVMYVGLLMNYSVVIAAFGAFKLGTRFKDSPENPVSNDYFLIGNLLSLLIVFAEVLLFQAALQMLVRGPF